LLPPVGAFAPTAAGPFTPRSFLVGYLPQAVVSLRIQIEQLMRLDFHQQNYSLVGCSTNPHLSCSKAARVYSTHEYSFRAVVAHNHQQNAPDTPHPDKSA
jgi:hypothetical protein